MLPAIRQLCYKQITIIILRRLLKLNAGYWCLFKGKLCIINYAYSYILWVCIWYLYTNLYVITKWISTRIFYLIYFVLRKSWKCKGWRSKTFKQCSIVLVCMISVTNNKDKVLWENSTWTVFWFLSVYFWRHVC